MDDIERYRKDPVTFIEECLIDPKTGKAFELYEEEKVFLRKALTLTEDGALPYSELVFSAPKKSGKTALAAMIMLYVIIVLSGSFAEGYSLANDLEQSTGRVFQAISRIIQASPMLRDEATITKEKIIFPATGAIISAVASDASGAAGANPNISVFDELWGYTSERSFRLWDEMIPPPTQKIALRLTVTYAGFEGESILLEGLYARAMAGQEIAQDLWENGSLLCYWTHRLCAPWQTQEWVENTRANSRPNAFLRHVENRWTTGSESFIEMEKWDVCVDQSACPLLSDQSLSVYLGVDASVKRDSTAIVACAFDHNLKKVRLIYHRIFQPSKENPLDFELTIENTLLELRGRFNLRSIRYDPYQLVSVAQRLTKQGLPMVEFPQSVPNLTEASNNFYELIKGRNLIVYPDPDIRLAVSRAVAVETPRGWRIAKEKASHKIDVVVALAQAALGAVTEGQIAWTVDGPDEFYGPTSEEILDTFEARLDSQTSRPWD